MKKMLKNLSKNLNVLHGLTNKGNKLKDPQDGESDKEGDDVPGFTHSFVSTR